MPTLATPATSAARPMFLDFHGRRQFALLIEPLGACTGAVLYLPPFAEEMNRCRSHVVALARALAARGQACLLLDPWGTGESEGATAEARWEHWRDDAAAAADWLRQRTGQPLALWGTRTGALLAADVMATHAPALSRVLFWQPVLDGKLFLNQYLRLRIASQMVHEAGERETTESIRARLTAGEDIEIAGYPLSGAMADALAARRIGDVASLTRQPLDWIEIVSKPEQPLGVPARKLADALAAAGGAVQTATAACPPIWQTYEREDAPDLLTTSLRLWEARA